MKNIRLLTVEWGDCDPAGIVFNPRYFAWFDAATAAFLERALGMKKADMIQRFNIIGIPLVASTASFKAPCRYGDNVQIETEVVSVRRTSFEVRHRLLREDGSVAVDASETRVWVGRDTGGSDVMKAKPLPEEVIQNLDRKSLLVSGP